MDLTVNGPRSGKSIHISDFYGVAFGRNPIGRVKIRYVSHLVDIIGCIGFGYLLGHGSFDRLIFFYGFGRHRCGWTKGHQGQKRNYHDETYKELT